MVENLNPVTPPDYGLSRKLSDYPSAVKTAPGAVFETPKDQRPVKPLSGPENKEITSKGHQTTAVSNTPRKPFSFALEQGSDTGTTRIYHGRLISSMNRIDISSDGVEDQTGVGLPAISIPDNFSGEPGEIYQFVDLDWVGNVYLYWETDGFGTVTLCDVRGPNEPDHVPLPLADGQTTGKFYVQIGTSSNDDLDGFVQNIASDVFWGGAFAKDLEGAGSAGSESSTGSTSTSSVGESLGSDKSTAIVPCGFHSTGFTALFTSEAPDVRFEDVMTIRARNRNLNIKIDPRFVEVCEKGTISVISVCSSSPAQVGATVEGGVVHVSIIARKIPEFVTLKLSGIRRGFKGMRFPVRSQAQFEANERFLNSAYPRK